MPTFEIKVVDLEIAGDRSGPRNNSASKCKCSAGPLRSWKPRPISPTTTAPSLRSYSRRSASSSRAPKLDFDVAQRFGQRLRALNYSDAGIAEVRGSAAADDDYDHVVLARQAVESDPLGAAIRLFALNLPVSRAAVGRALATEDIGALIDGHVLTVDGSMMRARIRLVPLGGLLLACDAGDPMTGNSEFITGATASTVGLLGHTIRRRADRTLDVGCGSGAQSIAAATHSRSVVATDANPRARSFVDLSAALNGLANVECRIGDWLDPVRDERFDLVVCNPPFVVSPDREFLFRDAGLRGDEISRLVVEQCAAHLGDGSFAHVMCSWLHHRDDWTGPVREWARGLGCDVWAFRVESMDPVAYATTWNWHLRERDRETFERAVDRWLGYYRELEVDRIALGVVIARRAPGASNWFRGATLAGPPSGDATDHLLRLFSIPARMSDEALLATRPRAPGGQTVDSRQVAGAGGYRDETATVRCSPGLGLTARIDPAAVPVVLGCGGSQSLREVIEHTGVGEEMALTTVWRLAELGLVGLS